MQCDVRQFVHEYPPEVVDPVISQGQPDHGSSIIGLHDGAIQMSSRQMSHQFNCDALLSQELNRLQGTVNRRAQSGDTNEQFRKVVALHRLIGWQVPFR